jgi:hypothetical protein
MSEQPCQCRCHAYGGRAAVSCDVGPEQPGGNLSCIVTHATEPAKLVPLDEACVLGHPEPAERYVGYACRRHYHWIDRTLAEIVELFALLDDVLLPGPANGGDRHATRDGSPAPGRVEVMALTDKRARGIGDSTQRDDIPDVPGTLYGWVRVLIEERGVTDDQDGTVTGSIRLLRHERHWIANQDWLDIFAEEITDLHRAVARGVGDSMWPRSIGKCPNCGTPMYPTIGADEAHCRKCKSSWTGIALARLRLIHEQEAS